MGSKSIGNLYVSLGLNSTPFIGGMADARKALEAFEKRTQQGGNGLVQLNGKIDLTSNSLRVLESTAKMAMGSLAAGIGVMGVKSLIDIADKYTLIEGRLRLVTKSSAELASVQASLYQISQKTRTDFSATADLYTSLARSTQTLGLSQGQLLTMVESVNKALIVSGASSESSKAALIQLGQGMASGVLRGEELNSVLEQTPRLAQMIADGMGITIGQLRQYGKDGKLTAEAVAEALISQADSVDAEYSRMGTTVSQAMTELRNAFESVINDANTATGSTQSLAGTIEQLAKTIEQNKSGIIEAFKGIAAAANWTIERFAAFGNSYALFKAYNEGKISRHELVMSNPEEAKRILARIGTQPGASIGDETMMQQAIAARRNAPTENSKPGGVKPTKTETSKGRSAANAAEREEERRKVAIDEARKALEKYAETHYTVEDATRRVSEAEQALQSVLSNKAAKAKEITSATKLYKEAQDDLKTVTEEWKKAQEAAEKVDRETNRLLGKQIDTALSYNDAVRKVTAAQVERARVEVLGSGHAKELEQAIERERQANEDLKDSIDAAKESWEAYHDSIKMVGDALSDIGSLMGGSVGKAISSIGAGISSFGSVVDTSGLTGQALTNADAKNYQAKVSGYAGIAQGIGALIGGKTGSTISSAASMAAAGSAFGPWGTVIGGAIGLVSSLFGGDSQAKAQRDDARGQVYNQMVQSALSGGGYSLSLLQSAGWNYDSLANYTGAGAIAGKGAGSRLLEDRGTEGAQRLSQFLSVMDGVTQTISEFTKPSLLSQLEQINTQYQYAISQAGNLAEIEQARMDSMIMALTNVSGNTIGSMIDEAISANVTGEAGAAFSAKFEASIAEAIRNMAISNLVTNSIMPVLQPVMTSLVSGLVSGSLSTTEMAALYGSIKSVSSQIAPMVTTLAQAFSDAGISTGAGSSTARIYASSSFASAADYQMAMAGVPGYADGGTFGGGWRVVGELGPELEYTGPSRIFSNAESRGLFDTSRLEAEMSSLRTEMQAGLYAIARQVARMAQITDKWDHDGLPKEAAA